jgi:hypothetical protein
MNKTLLLGRTFFRRFFETDFMPPGLPQEQLVLGAMTILAAPGLLLPFSFATRYSQMGANVQAIAHAMIVHRLLFVTFTMIALGLVALVIWEGVFPDRRDARILGTLPLPRSTLIIARLGALGALAAVFILGTNAVPTLVYGPVVGGFGGASTPLHGAAAHLIATAAAGAFVFFGLIALQGLLLNLAGRVVAEKLSIVLQLLFVIGLLQLIFFFPRIGPIVGHEMSDLTTHPFMRYVPSVWFLSLYVVIGGKATADTIPLAMLAAGLTSAVALLAVGLFVTTHGRLTRLALETRDGAGGRNRVVAAAARWANATLVRNSTHRAVLHFTLKTIARSRTHRMLVALYAGIALAFVVSAFIPLLMRAGLAGLHVPSIPLLSTPFVLMFLCLVGMRAAFAIPVEPKAAWVMRLLEPRDRVAAVDGARSAMLLAVVLPVGLLAAVSTAFLLDPRRAMVHAAICVLLGWLLAEMLALTLNKIPFTCTYYPGRSKLRTMWPLYLTAFTTFCYTTPALEHAAFNSRSAFLVFIAIVTVAIAVTRTVRSYRLRELPGFKFQEEDPEAMFQGFCLSEGLAANTPGGRR